MVFFFFCESMTWKERFLAMEILDQNTEPQCWKFIVLFCSCEMGLQDNDLAFQFPGFWRELIQRLFNLMDLWKDLCYGVIDFFRVFQTMCLVCTIRLLYAGRNIPWWTSTFSIWNNISGFVVMTNTDLFLYFFLKLFAPDIGRVISVVSISMLIVRFCDRHCLLPSIC